MGSTGFQSFKVVLLGEGRVGKTSLVLRYVRGVFSDSQAATAQAAFLSKRLTVEGQPLQLAIWDTAGQERFHSLGPIYYRDADAALLVYDVSDADTFERVQRWVKELQQMAPAGIQLGIAANKIDLDKNGAIDLDEARSYAEEIGATFTPTSAKQNTGVEEAFVDLARRLRHARKGVSANASSSSPAPVGRRKGVVVVDELPRIPPPKQGQCCG
eukprot:TRINITY_DN9761_c0_g1_i1.p1 TRINITY_DN9761_c0_g1~~TRINITY_DN9761_c0_g1_i1.p1  ORF type:complete len:214 (+),score=41.60 TRINITY_DN9761_c0_g1_i1:357-998(+)